MSNPYDLARELVKSLRNTPEYQQMMSAQAKIEKSDQLNQMLNAYRAIQVEVQTIQLQGQQPSAEVENKVNQLTKVIEDIPDLKAYLDSEEKFGVIFQDIQQIVMEPVVELFEDLDDD